MQQLPVSANERAEILDALRGFALLGIIIMNTAVFSGYVFISPEEIARLSTAPVDRFFDFMIIGLFMGKFYSIFSLLFGIGFAIFLSRKAKKGVAFFYRRLLVLMLIGLMHAFLAWDGDILFLYALLGCILPLFKNVSNRNLMLTAFILILSPVLIDALKIFFKLDPGSVLFRQGLKLDQQFGIVPDSFLFNSSAGYDEILKWNTAGFFYRWADLISSNRLVKVLGMFLLGFYTGRNLLHLKIEENRSRLRKIFFWSSLTGLPAAIVMAYVFLYQNSEPKMLHTISYALSVAPLSIAYTSGLCLLWLRPEWKKRLMIMAPAGRMALTNYLLQSLISIPIYYNIGFSLGTEVGPAFFVPVAASIWCLQIIYSKVWFRYYQFGPVEWFWRMLVYGKRIPIKNKKPHLKEQNALQAVSL